MVVLLSVGAIADQAPVSASSYGPIVEIQEIAQVQFRAPVSQPPRFQGSTFARPNFRQGRAVGAISRPPRFSVIRFQRLRANDPRYLNPRFISPNFARPTLTGSRAATDIAPPRAATAAGPVSKSSRQALGRFTKGIQGLTKD
jgi:hypothetical protein